MKKKFSKAMSQRVSELTNSIFTNAIKEICSPDEELSDDASESLAATLRAAKFVNDAFYQIEKIRFQKIQVDELYLKKLLKLTTSQLNEIMICHENEAPIRMQRTIEAILTEISSREILDDSSESDFNN